MNGNSTDKRPICRSSRVLKAMRLQMSRPKLSVPRMWPGLNGGRNDSVNCCAIGSYGVSRGAAIATRTTRPRSPRPVISVELSRIFRARITGVTRVSCTGPTPRAFSLIRHSRIEEGVGEVDDEVDDDDQDRTDHGDGLHDGVVARRDGLDQELPRSGQREHG